MLSQLVLKKYIAATSMIRFIFLSDSGNNLSLLGSVRHWDRQPIISLSAWLYTLHDLNIFTDIFLIPFHNVWDDWRARQSGAIAPNHYMHECTMHNMKCVWWTNAEKRSACVVRPCVRGVVGILVHENLLKCALPKGSWLDKVILNQCKWPWVEVDMD